MAHILIIDDDPEIRTFVTTCLGENGHMLMVADSLSEGRDLISIGKYDLIFLDVNLPDGIGLEYISNLCFY